MTMKKRTPAGKNSFSSRKPRIGIFLNFPPNLHSIFSSLIILKIIKHENEKQSNAKAKQNKTNKKKDNDE